MSHTCKYIKLKWFHYNTLLLQEMERSKLHDNVSRKKPRQWWPNDMHKQSFLTHLPLGHIYASWNWFSIVSVYGLSPVCQLDPWEQTSVKFKSKCTPFHWQTRISKCRLRNGGHVVQGEIILMVMILDVVNNLPLPPNQIDWLNMCIQHT